ncbi:hypothetical protein O181_123835 [Austropuccinia psidii MF-1]|uniref:Uncharacterized protein n=1 Tax=Austropuccinia psidii MF-1 TaxID=1389203 RepID=A0A9Q3Q4K9_9BASI|nr:hypothetical protein [Austropuccinia psidii MF-1]
MSFVLVPSLPKANLVQSALSYFNHNDPVSSPVHVNGLGGPTFDDIASIFGNPVPPTVNTPSAPSPGFLAPPPYEPHIIPLSPPAFQLQRKQHFNQV